MEKAGVPVVPGYHGDEESNDTLIKVRVMRVRTFASLTLRWLSRLISHSHHTLSPTHSQYALLTHTHITHSHSHSVTLTYTRMHKQRTSRTTRTTHPLHAHYRHITHITGSVGLLSVSRLFRWEQNRNEIAAGYSSFSDVMILRWNSPNFLQFARFNSDFCSLKAKIFIFLPEKYIVHSYSIVTWSRRNYVDCMNSHDIGTCRTTFSGGYIPFSVWMYIGSFCSFRWFRQPFSG